MQSLQPPSSKATASQRKNIKWYLLAAPFLVNVLIWYAIFSESRGEILTIAFLDVGQGDAIFIEAPNGNQMLVDGGPNRGVLKALSGVMPFYDRSIDVVVATHPDKDHIGGLPDVFKNFTVDFFIEPGVIADTGIYQELARLVELEGAAAILARRGMKILLDDNVYLLILFPDRDVGGLSPNDASIVARLVYGGTSFLLTGDSPKKIENFLVDLDRENLKADVLKVGHHGSKTGTSEHFLGYTAPRYAVISSGRENRYGHPHEEVLSLLKNFHIDVLRTDQLGSVIFTSNGEDIYFEK